MHMHSRGRSKHWHVGFGPHSGGKGWHFVMLGSCGQSGSGGGPGGDASQSGQGGVLGGGPPELNLQKCVAASQRQPPQSKGSCWPPVDEELPLVEALVLADEVPLVVVAAAVDDVDSAVDDVDAAPPEPVLDPGTTTDPQAAERPSAPAAIAKKRKRFFMYPSLHPGRAQGYVPVRSTRKVRPFSIIVRPAKVLETGTS
jgi:hypothetical protein